MVIKINTSIRVVAVAIKPEMDRDRVIRGCIQLKTTMAVRMAINRRRGKEWTMVHPQAMVCLVTN